MLICHDDNDRQSAVSLIEAILRFAEDSVFVTAEFLSTLPVELQPSSLGWPRALLLEASAVAMIQNWDGRGITSLIDPALPNSQVAWGSVIDRIKTDPNSFIQGRTPLLAQVFRAWFKQLVKHDCDTLHFELMFGMADQQNMVDELASLLWKFRYLVN